jgi:hypothetical protein
MLRLFFVAPFGFEPKTDYLEGSCSIQLSYGVENGENVGVAGFEPTTSWSQTRRDTGLRYTPKKNNAEFRKRPIGWSPNGLLSQPNIIVERGGFEPPVTFRATAV